MLVIWNERARPSRARSAVARRVMSRPAKRTVPASGVSSPVSWPISVVLPAPFGPISAWVSPVRMLSVTLSVATSAPNDLYRPSTCSRSFTHDPAPGLASADGVGRLGKVDLRLGRRLARAGRAHQHAPDAVAHQQHARDEQRSEEQHPVLGIVRQHVAEREEERRAEDRADQRVGRAQDDHRQKLAGQLPAQHRWIDELGVVRHQRAGQAGDAARDHEDHELVGIGRKADRGGAALVVADAADHHAEFGAHQPVRQPEYQHQQDQHDVIEMGRDSRARGSPDRCAGAC